MIDQFNRTIEYMRISITDRCNLNCNYCRPEVCTHLSHSDILSYEEILRVCNIIIKLGINKFKITGGEPFTRKNAIDFMAALRQFDGVDSVTVTSNATLIDNVQAEQLRASGIDGINISLDTMDSDKYFEITGYGQLDKVMNTIKDCYEAGLRVKINTVLLPTITKEDIMAIIQIAKNKKIDVRFIEMMPMGTEVNGTMSGSQVREMLAMEGIELKAVSKKLGNGPARYYKADGFEGCFGFIEAIHGKFCDSCNRIRMTSTGLIKPCLYYSEGVDIRQMLRDGTSDEVIENAIRHVIFNKPKAHRFEEAAAKDNMSRIGG